MNKRGPFPASFHLHTKVILLIVLLGVFCISLFYILWHNQDKAAQLCEQAGLIDWFDEAAFREKAERLAKNYDVPPYYESDEGINDPAVIAFQPYLDQLADEFTGVYIYGNDDGLFRAGKSAGIVNRSWFNTIWTLEFKMLGEETADFPVAFSNGTYTILYYSYHRVIFAYPYTIGCIVLCLLLFFSGILLYVNRMVRRIQTIKFSILQMANGDLQTVVPPCGSDEIGIVANELDILRNALETSFRQEQESLQANQDLITALSHDLRTPLTVLTGYLELLKRSSEITPNQAIIIERCLEKSKDLRILSDKMFDAAQINALPSAPVLKQLPISSFISCINDNIDFIQIAGFAVESDIADCSGMLFGDTIMLKRIADNLFSNILKYGAKNMPVHITIRCDTNSIALTLKNTISENTDSLKSSQIGLRNVEKMIAYHHGSFFTAVSDQCFIANMRLPICEK